MSQKPCPSCGYCPACKRRNVQPWPYHPGPIWVDPNHWGTYRPSPVWYGTTTTGTNTTGGWA